MINLLFNRKVKYVLKGKKYTKLDPQKAEILKPNRSTLPLDKAFIFKIFLLFFHDLLG